MLFSQFKQERDKTLKKRRQLENFMAMQQSGIYSHTQFSLTIS